MPNIVYGFNGQDEYENYLVNRPMCPGGVQSSVSRLNRVSYILASRLTADMVVFEQQIKDIAEQLRHAGVGPGPMSDCKTALRNYCRALNGHNPR